MTRIAAHLIVGSRPEPFLGALLASLEGVAQTVIVNDNSAGPSPHRGTLEASAFAKREALVIDRTPFAGFERARNICLRLHAERDAGDWVAFVDADEVHGTLVARIASHLDLVPTDVGAVDGYTWHFFGSFDWYTSIERRMMFYRFDRSVHWVNPVHEQLIGLPPRRLVVPYVYAHYGHTLEARRHAEKGRQYSGLGAEGEIVREEDLDSIDVASYYADYFPRLLHFTGDHPPAARTTIAALSASLTHLHELTDRIARKQPLPVKLRNVVRKLNYEQRWRLRVLNPLARRVVSA
jgi:hypothetical protein